jgi:hypothetical protein
MPVVFFMILTERRMHMTSPTIAEDRFAMLLKRQYWHTALCRLTDALSAQLSTRCGLQHREIKLYLGHVEVIYELKVQIEQTAVKASFSLWILPPGCFSVSEKTGQPLLLRHQRPEYYAISAVADLLNVPCAPLVAEFPTEVPIGKKTPHMLEWIIPLPLDTLLSDESAATLFDAVLVASARPFPALYLRSEPQKP